MIDYSVYDHDQGSVYGDAVQKWRFSCALQVNINFMVRNINNSKQLTRTCQPVSIWAELHRGNSFCMTSQSVLQYIVWLLHASDKTPVRQMSVYVYFLQPDQSSRIICAFQLNYGEQATASEGLSRFARDRDLYIIYQIQRGLAIRTVKHRLDLQFGSKYIVYLLKVSIP